MTPETKKKFMKNAMKVAAKAKEGSAKEEKGESMSERKTEGDSISKKYPNLKK